MLQPSRQGRLGRYEMTAFGGEPARAFVPPPLPPTPPINVSGLLVPLQRAQMVLGRLDDMTTILPDTNLFHEPVHEIFDKAGAMAKTPPWRATAPVENRRNVSNQYSKKRFLTNTNIMMKQKKIHVIFIGCHILPPGWASEFSSQPFNEGNCIFRNLRLT